MKKINYLSAIAAAIAAVSCVQEEAPVGVPQEGTGEAVVFSATFSEKPDSKATLTEGEEKSVVSWEQNDEVVIFEGTKSFTYVATPVVGNEKNATLAPENESVESAEGEHYALFLHPSGNAEGTLDGNVITTTLPAVQIAEPNTFATHLAVAKATGTSFSFKNVCGLVRVEIKTSDVKSVVLEGLNGETVAGGIKVTVADAPTWAVDGENGSKTVTLKAAADDAAIAPGVYFFAVLPQTFENGFKVTTNKLSGDPVVRTTAAGVTVERCQIVKGSANSVLGAGTEANPYVLMTAEDMCQMRNLAPVGEETWFKLGADIDMADVEKWTPVNFDSSFERKIHFDGAKVINPMTKADCYTISNFAPASFVDESDAAASYPSIFGVLYGSCKNVNIVNAKINIKTVSVGILGGYVGTTGKPAEVSNVHISALIYAGNNTGAFGGQSLNATYTDCTADVEIETYGTPCGGYIGASKGNVTIDNCAAVINLTSNNADFGGFVGKSTGTIDMIDSSSEIEFHSSKEVRARAGGLVGYVAGTDSNFDGCSSTGTIYDEFEATSSHIISCGGLFGYLGSSTTAVISNCTSSVNINTEYGTSIGGVVGIHGKGSVMISSTTTSGSISGYSQLGGIAGLVEGGVSSISISSSNSSADVTGANNYCGGMIGWLQCPTMVNLNNCHTTGDVISSGSSIGGFVGASVANDGKEKTGGVSFENCSSTGRVSGASNVGGFVGHRRGGGDFTNCYHEDGKLTGTASACGGLVGHFRDGGNVIGCYSECEIVGETYVGGLIGSLTDIPTGGKSIISDSYHKNGNITGSTTRTNEVYVGGLIGSSYGAEYRNCYAECDVETTGIYAGGLVGWQRVSSTFNKCHFNGNINGAVRHVGGIAGRANYGTTISNCCASGNLSTTNNWVGGLLAYSDANVTIECSYSNCNVSGVTNAGGLIGQCTVALTANSSIAWGTVSLASEKSLGAIAGAAGTGSTITTCYYNPSFTPAEGATGLHGTAASAGSTISSLAETLGWDKDIWDLTGTVPVLK